MKCDRCGKENPAEVHTCASLAMRLADALQAGADDPMWADHCEMSKRTASLSAAELRRLSAENDALREANEAFGKRQEWWNEKMFALEEVNAELLEALKMIANLTHCPDNTMSDKDIARAAIAKAGG
jgi:hypothetical protein